MSAQPQHRQPKSHVTTFEVDGELIETTERELTPVEIMQLAGVDPATHYLKEIRGKRQISYKDKPNDPIKIHNKQRFVANSLEPTPVS